MKYWLIKSEPDAWSWEQQVAKGAAGEPWSGVRNHTAKLNLMAMKKGDRAFFYHSNIGKEIVGIAEISQAGLADPTDPEGKWAAVRVKPVRKLAHPVTLKAIKDNPAAIAIVNNTALSLEQRRAELKKLGYN